MPHLDYPCPVCQEWIEILPTTPEALNCPWCKEPLKLSVDVDNYGMSNQRDLTRLISNRQHIERMIEHAKRVEVDTDVDQLKERNGETYDPAQDGPISHTNPNEQG